MEPWKNSNVLRAIIFATRAHGAQTRKYTFEPYIVHPLKVATILERHNQREEVIIAGILHDVVEDTSITNDVIAGQFGLVVAQLVYEVTDISKPGDGNRAFRKAMDRQHLERASPEGQTIKLADMIDNTESIVANDLDFAVIFLREMKEVLDVLTKGDAALLALARKTYDDAVLTLETARRPATADS